MAFSVVLDACVLYPASLRDTLLRLAEAEFFDLYWSDQILDEVHRNLVANAAASQEQADKLIAAMKDAFDGAVVPAEQIAALLPAMGNDKKDRHVLAAAKASGAEQIVTANVEHFPEEHTAPLGIEAITPDEFLLNQLSLDSGLVIEVLRRQAAALNNPSMTLEELLEALRKVVPGFVAAVGLELT
jgi:predicted nucleic acid-binding protein